MDFDQFIDVPQNNQFSEITLSDDQNRAVKAIRDWYFNSPKPYFYLAGFAGVGKTAILPYAIAECGLDPHDSTDVLFGSFTGKAASVMRKRGLRHARTIHSLIYKLIDDKEELIFMLNLHESPVRSCQLLALDEVSMINDEMGRDISKFGKKVLVLGDPGQIKPISGTEYYTKGDPDFFLKEVHRQALDNPIIRASMAIRENRKIEADPMDDRLIIAGVEDLEPHDWQTADQIITGKHVTRRDLNRLLLEFNGFQGFVPDRPGIKVICKRNQKNGLFNGMIGYTATDASYVNMDKPYMVQTIHMPDESLTFRDLNIHLGHFLDHGTPRTKDQIDRQKLTLRNMSEFDFGYAITGHSSQGSQWDNVVFVDDGFGWEPDDRRRWLYTGFTRAAETLIYAQ